MLRDVEREVLLNERGVALRIDDGEGDQPAGVAGRDAQGAGVVLCELLGGPAGEGGVCEGRGRVGGYVGRDLFLLTYSLSLTLSYSYSPDSGLSSLTWGMSGWHLHLNETPATA